MGTGSEKYKKFFEAKDLGVSLCTKISADGLKLVVDCEKIDPKDKRKIDADSLAYILKNFPTGQKFKHSTLMGIATLLNKGKPVENCLLIRGIEPVKGEDGKLKVFPNMVPEKVGAKGIKSRDIRDLDSVVPGMCIGKIYPPTEGQEGADVLGQPIAPAKGKEFKINCDKSIIVRETTADTKLLIAARPGYLTQERGRLCIISELNIKGDVDVTAGKIDYIDAILVNKDVSKGAKIGCRGNLTINGMVHGGNLSSTCGSIAVRGYLNGGPQYRINALGHLTAQMVQNIHAKVDGDILIQKDARDCNLETLGKVVMSTGHIFGGKTKALYGVEAKNIGTDGGSLTQIIGTCDAELEKEKLKLEEHLVELEEIAGRIREGIAPFLAEEGPLPDVSNAHLIKINRLIVELNKTELERDLLTKRIQLLAEEQGQATFLVNYGNTIHKGVIIRVGEEEYRIDQDIKGPGTIEFNPETRKFSVGRPKPIGARTEKKPKPEEEVKNNRPEAEEDELDADSPAEEEVTRVAPPG